eukprot:scaffold212079_cov36-Prasinocladus_malaysianus.AAC.2
MKLDIKNRKGAEVVRGGLEVTDGGSVDDLQRLTLLPKEGEARGQVLAPGKKLSDYGLSEGSQLLFKDLGPQIGYKTVFFWEYFGP